MTLGEIIKEYRQKHCLTMEQFGMVANLTKGYVSMLEKNKNPRNGEPIKPSLETVKSVAKILHITIDELLNMLDDNQEIILNTSNPVPDAISITYSPSSKEQELKNMLEHVSLSDEQLDILITMIKSWI